MIKRVACIGIVLAIALSIRLHHAEAGSPFDMGFQGIAWGTHKDDLPDIGLSKKIKKKNIYKRGESAIMFLPGMGKLTLKFGDVPLISLFLRFNNAVFYGVDMIFNPADRDVVLARLSEDLASQGRSTETGNVWETDTLRVELTDREVMIVSRGVDRSARGKTKDSKPAEQKQACCE